MRPSQDPASTKYPGRVFFAGQWRTPQQMRKRRATVRTVDSRRLSLRVGGLRISYHTDPTRREEIRQKLSEFREQQSRTRMEKETNGWID